MKPLKTHKILSNGWVIGIFSAVIAGLILKLIDLFTGSKILSWIWGSVKMIFLKSLAFFNQGIELKLYFLFLLPLMGLAVLIFILWIISIIPPTKKEVLPNWLRYTEDIFDNVRYRWEYIQRTDGKFCVDNIIAHCVRCKCLIIDEFCPNCNTSYCGRIKRRTEVEALIRHRIEKNYNPEN